MSKPVQTLAFAGLIGCAVILVAEDPRARAQQMSPEREKVCKEAEARYQELFGKPTTDEPHVVILMYEYTFCPPDRELKAGTRVRWVNVDKRTSHSVWFKEAGEAESNRVFSEEHVEKTIELAPGIHTYICGPHWEKRAMIGQLKVVP